MNTTKIQEALKARPISLAIIPALAIALSFGLNYAYATWAEPVGTPPNNNTDAPLNVGPAAQTKAGTLSLAAPLGNLSLVTYGLSGSDQPQDANGSMNVNDIYLRSVGKWASQLDTAKMNTLATPVLLYTEYLNKPAHVGDHVIDISAYVPTTAQTISLLALSNNGQNFCDRLFWLTLGAYDRNGVFFKQYIPVHTYNQNAWYLNSMDITLPVSADRKLYFHHPYMCGDTYNTGGSAISFLVTGYL